MGGKLFFTGVLMVLVCGLRGQSVGISSTVITPDGSSILEIQSNNKGMLIPRVALSATNVAAPVTLPATSLMVYNTATAGAAPNQVTPGYYYNAGTPAAPNWVRFLTLRDAWLTTGNTGTTPALNWLGTNDAQDLAIRTNNTEKMRIMSGGNVGIGTAAPAFKLHVDGLNSTAIRGQYDANRYVEIASSAYGVYSRMNSGAGTAYGGYFSGTSTASASCGIAAESIYSGTGNSSYSYGARIVSTSTTQDQYGIYNTANHSGTGGFLYGIRNDANLATGNATTLYGLYNSSIRNGDESPNYGIYSSASNGTIAYGLYATAAGGLTNWAGYFGNGDVYVSNNLGIGITPTQRLDVGGNVQFSAALMPAGDPGTTGKVLKSNGANVPPTWISAVTPDNIYTVESTSSLAVTSGTFTAVPGESITINGLNAGDRVLIWFGGNMYMDGSDYNDVDVALFINGTMAVVGGFVRVSLDSDAAYVTWQNFSAIARYNVTAAGNYTFDVRARRLLGGNTIYVGGDATQAAEGVLMIFVLRN